MNEKETIKFYDGESTYYTLKRYEIPMIDFTQFYFRKRLAIVLKYIREATNEKKGLDLLEVGCADGIVIRKIEKEFPRVFKKLVGTDISSGMIVEAKKRNASASASFFLRGEENQEDRYDIVLEVGFLTTPILENELLFVANALKKDGYFICSLSLKDSLRMKLKSKDDSYVNTHYGPVEYEKLLNRHFTIMKKEAYGIFIPYLWKAPSIARVLQPFFEMVLKPFFSSFFHENIYLVQKK